MPPHWEVHSFQLNIDEGDSAIHLLTDVSAGEDSKVIEQAVLVDGGKSVGADIIWDFRNLLRSSTSGYKQKNGQKFTEFDTIVISHWDSDHRDGIVSLIQDDIEQAARAAIKQYQIHTQDQFDQIINEFAIQSSYTKYNGSHGEPSTILYAPYWRVSNSNTNTRFNDTFNQRPDQWRRLVDNNQRKFVAVKVELKSLSDDWVKGKIPIALLNYNGKGLLGLDFFTGNRVMTAAQAKCPAHVSQYLASQNYWKPVMFCVAADSWVCDPDGTEDRAKNWNWVYGPKTDLSDVRLERKPNQPFRSDALGGGAVREQSSFCGDISVQSIIGNTTGNNQASIACMIIWPSQLCDISLYIGGDLGDEMEEEVLRWSTTVTDDPNVRHPPRIDGLKLSHHGSKQSTPAIMFLAWKPEWIIASNGMKAQFNHVSWETAYLCMVYAYWANTVINQFRIVRPLIATNYPIYLTTYVLADEVTAVNCGAIDSLIKPNSGPVKAWRETINLMWTVVNNAAAQHNPPPQIPPNLLQMQLPGNVDDKKTFVCNHLNQWWDRYSFVPGLWYGGVEGFENGMNKAAAQNVRWLAFKQGSQGHTSAGYAMGVSVAETDTSMAEEIMYDSIFSPPTNQEPECIKVAKIAVNDKTKRNVEANRWGRKNVTGALISSAQAVIWNSTPIDSPSAEKLIDCESDEEYPPNAPALQKLYLSTKAARRRRKLAADTALCYFMATDAIETKGPVKNVKAKANSNLDLFLSSLTTGALVLPDKLDVKPNELQVDGSDDLLQWLQSIFGDFDDPGFAITTKTSTVNISSISYTTRLDKAIAKSMSFSDSKLNSMIRFSTDNNATAFKGASDPAPTWLGPPANGTADVDIDIVGPAFMLLMGLSSSSGIEQATITGREIVDLFEVKLPKALEFFASLTNFNIDTSPGTKCGLWFFPDVGYTTTLRLQFKAAEGDPASALASKVKDTIKDITSVVQIDVGKVTAVAKKTWSRSRNLAEPASADVESKLIICAPITFHRQQKALTTHLQPKLESFTVDTALEVVQGQKKRTNFILTFDPSKGGTSFTDLLEFFVSLLPGNPELPSLAQYLPGSDSILLRRITYVVPAKGGKAVMLDLQAGWASMVLQCTLKYRFGQDGGATFGGSLFLNNQLSQLGPRFSFVPYMPDYESWTALTIIPKEKGGSDGKAIANLGDIYGSLTKAEGNEKKLENPPTSLQLLGLRFYLTSESIQFEAVVISPKPEKDSVPQIRLTSARLNVLFAYKKPELKRLAFHSNFVLQPRNSTDYATLAASLEYASNKWTLTGSVGRLSGAILYSLFDNSCDEEMVELLRHISLDVYLKYNYDSSGKGSDFVVSGNLYLGAVTLDYEYNYKGKNAGKDEPLWTLNADLSVDKGDGTLIDIIAAICGTDIGNLLPSWLKSVPTKTSGGNKLTSLRVRDLGTAVLLVLRVQLTGGTSIAFYRLSQKKAVRNNLADDKPPVTKTVLVLTVDKLPTVENIPLIGSLPQPFDEFHFAWISSNEDVSGGLTRLDVQNIGKGRGADDPELKYKDNVKKDQQKDADVLLASGFHFIVVANKKTVLDYAFGGKTGNSKEICNELNTFPLAVVGGKSGFGIQETATSPIDKTFGPVKITGLGLGFDLKTNTLSIVIDGTLTLGPLAMSLLGFAVNFSFEGKNLRDLSSVKPSFDLRGLGASFQRDPLILQGMFERGLTDDGDPFFQGAATVGFTPYLFQAVGYYGKARDQKKTKGRVLFAQEETFNTFFTYCRLDGPIMTIFGFAELTGLSGGFGYNSTIAYPTTQNLLTFPFIAPPDEDDPSKALFQFFQGGWFSPKRGSYWIAAGFKVLAFEMLEVQTVLTVEFGTGLKFGLFGLATAEMPKKAKKKFVRVQLGLAATVDFDAGLMKVDGQLTPASFVLDPSCRLTGGFAMYSWFDSRDPALNGDWVFSVGGYHKSFKVPTQYPVPPRLGITWSFDDAINITGESYFAINSKVCMGGGRLHVVLSAGPLYAYFDAYADFLINYKPFHFQAEGGVSVGVHFALDLWLVTIQIKIDLSARLYLQGPPVNGTVHVDFYVFGFDVKFGARQDTGSSRLSLDEFYRLALQADNQAAAAATSFFAQEEIEEDEDEDDDDDSVEAEADLPDDKLVPHIFSCTSGLIPADDSSKTAPNDAEWNVRGAVFAFDVSCKFALTGADVVTKSLEVNGEDATHPVINKATGKMYSKPMWLRSPFSRSHLTVTIAKDVPAVEELTDDPKPLNPEWDNNFGILTSVPTALWGAYNPSEDPSSGNNNVDKLLDGTKEGTVQLLTGASMRSPTPRRSPDIIAEFDVQVAMGKVAGLAEFPCTRAAQAAWKPQLSSTTPYADVRARWTAPLLGGDAGVRAAQAWCKHAAFRWDEAVLTGKRPEKLIAELEQHYTEAPRLSSDGQVKRGAFLELVV